MDDINKTTWWHPVSHAPSAYRQCRKPISRTGPRTRITTQSNSLFRHTVRSRRNVPQRPAHHKGRGSTHEARALRQTSARALTFQRHLQTQPEQNSWSQIVNIFGLTERVLRSRSGNSPHGQRCLECKSTAHTHHSSCSNTPPGSTTDATEQVNFLRGQTSQTIPTHPVRQGNNTRTSLRTVSMARTYSKLSTNLATYILLEPAVQQLPWSFCVVSLHPFRALRIGGRPLGDGQAL